MKTFATILTGAAGLAMIAGAAAPAAAQTSPYGGYNNNGGIGGVIQSILGGGRYGAYGQGNDRVAVDQCARAVEARVNGDYRSNRTGAYAQGWDNRRHGYNQAAVARVVGITNVQRSSRGLKVFGVMDSGRFNSAYGYGNQGYAQPQYDQYGRPVYAQQGYAQTQQYDQYGRPVYVQQGYGQGYGQPAYGQPAYANGNQNADLRFNCRVDARGYVSDVNVSRNTMARRGY